MSSESKPLPLNPDAICTGKPSSEESQSCVDAESNESVMAVRQSSSEVLAVDSSSRPLGLPPLSLTVETDVRGSSQPQPLGFAPRALIAMVNNVKRKP